MASRKSIIESGYSIPRIAPLYGSPPFEYRNTLTTIVLFKTTPEVTKELVPEPLVPNPDNLMLIIMNQMNVVNYLSYNEAILTVPSIFEEIVGYYNVYLYCDEVLPIVAGREIWGFPKKEARITYVEKYPVLTATLERGGIELIRTTMEITEPARPEEIQLDLPWFNFKLIPSVKKDAPPDVKQLTSNTFENIKVKQINKGKATLEFGISPDDPLNKIAIKEVLGGYYINFDFTLTYGDVIYDYLSESQ